jgi:tetratricopeptide (TPR) repeat protein
MQSKTSDLTDQGYYYEALEYFDKALSISPNHVPSLIDKGGLLLAAGNYSDVSELFNRALQINPNSLTLNNIAWAITIHSGNYTQALEIINRTLEIIPADFYSMDTKTLILDQLGRRKEAIE